MSFESGTRIGSYELKSTLGEGGMGVVYRATDVKLHRDVALKVLPDHFADNPDRLARFQREAQVLASLNHPNIAHVYGLEESGTSHCIIMELVEGETLQQRLTRGPLAIDETLQIAKQIAEALEAAHERNIIHRDLKPGNIMLTADGRVKVLDFGLAKAIQEQQPQNLSNSPTMLSGASMPGVILGTASYMSPEQAKARIVDQRTDIFAFGCVLYEMLTGKRAFDGEDVTDILSAVMRMEPDWTRLPNRTPPAAGRLLKLCLEKTAKNRRGTASDVRLDLEQAMQEAHGAVGRVVTEPQNFRLAWVVASVAMLGSVLLAVLYFRTPASIPTEMRLDINTPSTSQARGFALSPDGQSIVFVASGTGAQRLWLRRLDKTEAQPLPGTEGAAYPFWSPDGKSIGFTTTGVPGQLKRADIAGGTTMLVANVGFTEGSWNAAGTILFSASGAKSLRRVSASGGDAVDIMSAPVPGSTIREPRFLPDGNRFLFFLAATAETQGVYVGAINGPPPKRLTAADSAAEFLPPDRLVFVRQGIMVARKLDLKRMELVGEAETLADSVELNPGLNISELSVSPNGRIAYRRGGKQERFQLTWFDRSGKSLGDIGQPDLNSLVLGELSPDGGRLVIDRNDRGNRDVWLVDLIRGGLTRFTFDLADDGYPVWSPDGTQIAFESNRKGTYDIYLKPATGVGPEKLLLETPGSEWPVDWSRDGQFLLYRDSSNSGDLLALPMTAERKPVVITNTQFTERNGKFSPDGHWVAYDTNESGQFEVVVQPFPNPTRKFQISTAGGTHPRWSADGRELYFVALDKKLMAVTLRPTGNSLDAGAPLPLFQTQIDTSRAAQHRAQYTIAADGKFLINQPLETPTVEPITLILNWRPKNP